MTQAHATTGRPKSGRKTQNPLMGALNAAADRVGVTTDELLLPIARRIAPDTTVTPAMISNTVRGRGSVAIAAAITWVLDADAQSLWPEITESRRAQIDAARAANFDG